MKKQLISFFTWPAFLSIILLGCTIETAPSPEFSVYSFPTFVQIDSKGLITQVVSGYGEEVEDLIFGYRN